MCVCAATGAIALTARHTKDVTGALLSWLQTTSATPATLPAFNTVLDCLSTQVPPKDLLSALCPVLTQLCTDAAALAVAAGVHSFVHACTSAITTAAVEHVGAEGLDVLEKLLQSGQGAPQSGQRGPLAAQEGENGGPEAARVTAAAAAELLARLRCVPRTDSAPCK